MWSHEKLFGLTCTIKLPPASITWPKLPTPPPLDSDIACMHAFPFIDSL